MPFTSCCAQHLLRSWVSTRVSTVADIHSIVPLTPPGEDDVDAGPLLQHDLAGVWPLKGEAVDLDAQGSTLAFLGPRSCEKWHRRWGPSPRRRYLQGCPPDLARTEAALT